MYHSYSSLMLLAIVFHILLSLSLSQSLSFVSKILILYIYNVSGIFNIRKEPVCDLVMLVLD